MKPRGLSHWRLFWDSKRNFVPAQVFLTNFIYIYISWATSQHVAEDSPAVPSFILELTVSALSRTPPSSPLELSHFCPTNNEQNWLTTSSTYFHPVSYTSHPLGHNSIIKSSLRCWLFPSLLSFHWLNLNLESLNSRAVKHLESQFNSPSFIDEYNQEYIPYLAAYNAHFFAQIFEGKIRMRIIHGKC